MIDFGTELILENEIYELLNPFLVEMVIVGSFDRFKIGELEEQPHRFVELGLVFFYLLRRNARCRLEEEVFLIEFDDFLHLLEVVFPLELVVQFCLVVGFGVELLLLEVVDLLDLLKVPKVMCQHQILHFLFIRLKSFVLALRMVSIS